MNHDFKSAEHSIAELTIKSILLAIVLTVLLAMSNAYLALKLGLLTSASIPAAILSMGILRFFKSSTILENNAVQTAASAGEAVAGGIVYTIPALIIIEYWHQFDYWTNFFIAFSGGVLGVLFSIPLRKILVHEPTLKFPEGQAIAEVLKSSNNSQRFIYLLCGGFIGAIFESFQMGFKLLASNWSHWISVKKIVIGVSLGFSATMLGAGLLIGQDMAISIFMGAIIAWFVGLPAISVFYHHEIAQQTLNASEMMIYFWEHQLRYLGIGAMLFAGVWTLLQLLRPLFLKIQMSFFAFSEYSVQSEILRTERDIPWIWIILGTMGISWALFLFFQSIFPLSLIGFTHHPNTLLIGAVGYIVIIGFLFSVITAYFSGMVGVSASPGSSVVIAGLLFAAWLLLYAIRLEVPFKLSFEGIKAAEAITIIIGSIVTGIAAIANDNTQDLKVGQLVGATPWKQQLMLLLGVLVASLVIPPVMRLLFDVYGIAGIMPREGMDVSQSLPAPTAALLAAITTAVFHHEVPWGMMGAGAICIMGLLLFYRIFKLQRYFRLSVLGMAVGMYLPLSSSIPLFIGGMISFIAYRKSLVSSKQIGTLIACGLVAGSALMDVFLAGCFSISKQQDILSLAPLNWQGPSFILSIVSVILLGLWIIRAVSKPHSS